MPGAWLEGVSWCGCVFLQGGRANCVGSSRKKTEVLGADRGAEAPFSWPVASRCCHLGTRASSCPSFCPLSRPKPLWRVLSSFGPKSSGVPAPRWPKPSPLGSAFSVGAEALRDSLVVRTEVRRTRLRPRGRSPLEITPVPKRRCEGEGPSRPKPFWWSESPSGRSLRIGHTVWPKPCGEENPSEPKPLGPEPQIHFEPKLLVSQLHSGPRSRALLTSEEASFQASLRVSLSNLSSVAPSLHNSVDSSATQA